MFDSVFIIRINCSEGFGFGMGDPDGGLKQINVEKISNRLKEYLLHLRGWLVGSWYIFYLTGGILIS
jgi:hypothetical protein